MLSQRAALFATTLLFAALPSCKPASSAPAPAAPNATVTVASAASVRPAMDAIIAEYQRDHKDVQIVATYGASGTLVAQIANGAPFDLFYSADTKYPQELIKKNLTQGAERIYATGTLVLWTRKDSGIDLASRGASALSDAAVRHIAIANPETAPYGRAAKAAMAALNVTAVDLKLVTGENVEQTAQFAQAGAADVAFVPLSLALSPAMKDVGTFWTVPPESYPKMEHAVVRTLKAGDAAAAFDAFVAGPRGREILASSGFGPVLE